MERKTGTYTAETLQELEDSHKAMLMFLLAKCYLSDTIPSVKLMEQEISRALGVRQKAGIE